VAGALCGGAATAISLLVRHRAERRFDFSRGQGPSLLTTTLARLPLEAPGCAAGFPPWPVAPAAWPRGGAWPASGRLARSHDVQCLAHAKFIRGG
jgi:hypothetical protein